MRDRVLVESEACHVRAAIDSWTKANKPGPEQVITVRILAEGETVEDVARSTYEDLRLRFGLDAP